MLPLVNSTFKIGDKVKRHAGNIEWTIEGYVSLTDEWVLKHGSAEIKVDTKDLYLNYEYSSGNTSVFKNLPNGYTTVDELEKKKEHCWHEWVLYTGLRERYYYCQKCDEKKEYTE